MKQDRLLFGLIGIVIGLIAGVLISRNSRIQPPVSQPPKVAQTEPQRTPASPSQIQAQNETPAPQASPQAQPQEQPRLPKGHPPVADQSLQEQIATLEVKVKNDPKNQTALIALGNLNADSGNFAKAAEWYQKALVNDANNVGLISDLGTCYLQMQDFDKSYEYYRKALSIDPNHYQTLVNFSIYYMQTGEKDKAAETLEKALTLYPNDPRAPQFKKAIEKIRSGKQQ